MVAKKINYIFAYENIKCMIMDTMTLAFENSTIKDSLKKVIGYMRGVHIVNDTPDREKNGLDKALDDIKAGRVYEADSVDDMFKQILG